MVLLQNATVAINTVVQSVLRTLKAGDSILILSLAYGVYILATFPVGSKKIMKHFRIRVGEGLIFTMLNLGRL